MVKMASLHYCRIGNSILRNSTTRKRQWLSTVAIESGRLLQQNSQPNHIHPLVLACDPSTSRPSIGVSLKCRHSHSRFFSSHQDASKEVPASIEHAPTLVGKAQALADENDKSRLSSEEWRNEAAETLHKLAGVGSTDSFKLSSEILCLLIDNMGEGGHDDSLNTELLNEILKNWRYSHLAKEDASIRLVSHVKGRIPPDRTTFSWLLSTRCNEDGSEGKILKCYKLLKNSFEDDPELLLQIEECKANALIQVHARSGDIGQAISEAKQLVDGKDEKVCYNLHDETFMSILVGVLTQQKLDQDDVSKTLDFLDWASVRYRDGSVEVNPRSVSLLGTVVSGGDCGWQTESPDWLLEALSRVSDNDPPSDQVDVGDYLSAIKVWASAGETETSLALLNHMDTRTSLAPNLDCCNAILSALATSKDGADRAIMAKNLLNRMTDYMGIVPNHASYQLVMDCWRNSGREEAGNEALLLARVMSEAAKKEFHSQRCPSRDIYLRVLSLVKEDLSLFEEWFDWVESEARTWKHEHAPVVHFSDFSSWLSTVKSSEDPSAGEQALMIFDRMSRLHEEGLRKFPPNRETYTLVLQCLLISGHPRTISWMEEAVSNLELKAQEASDGGMKVHKIALDMLSLTGEAQRVEEMMLRIRETQPDTRSWPRVDDYNTLLRAWSNSEAPDAAERASAIIEHMKELHDVHLEDSMPNQVSYQLLLNCWKKSPLPMAKQRAARIREEVQRFVNSSTRKNKHNKK